jgi:hypothetical protein
MKLKLIILILTSVLFSCQEGLKAPDYVAPSYLRGTITYKNGADSWPDSVVAIRVGAFLNDKPESFQDEVLNGNVFVDFNSLPLRVDSSNWELLITDPPVELKYIVVALQSNTNIFNQQVVGVYTISGDKSNPSWIKVEKGESFNNINIEVDFENLPPQPFGI